MNVVRGRAEARWLPSRHRFALFRLAAYLRLRHAKPEPAPGLLLTIDRDQSSIEQNSIALWVYFMVTCYCAATLFGAWPWPATLAVSLPVAAVVVEVPLCVTGVLLNAVTRDRWGNNLKVQSALNMLLLLLAASYFALSRQWIRFVAWQFLALFVLNALCAAIVFALRRRIAELESRYGGAPSAG